MIYIYSLDDAIDQISPPCVAAISPRRRASTSGADHSVDIENLLCAMNPINPTGSLAPTRDSRWLASALSPRLHISDIQPTSVYRYPNKWCTNAAETASARKLCIARARVIGAIHSRIRTDKEDRARTVPSWRSSACKDVLRSSGKWHRSINLLTNRQSYIHTHRDTQTDNTALMAYWWCKSRNFSDDLSFRFTVYLCRARVSPEWLFVIHTRTVQSPSRTRSNANPRKLKHRKRNGLGHPRSAPNGDDERYPVVDIIFCSVHLVVVVAAAAAAVGRIDRPDRITIAHHTIKFAFSTSRILCSCFSAQHIYIWRLCASRAAKHSTARYNNNKQKKCPRHENRTAHLLSPFTVSF